MRFDLRIVTSFIEEGARVLDLGCGTGDLLRTLREEKKVEGRGIEIDGKEVIACVEKGLPVLQGDMHEETRDLADGSFDYVILSQTLQQVYRPEWIIGEMLRVGKRGIVSFPCFGHYAIKAQLLFRSRAPVTKELPFQWYDTPNIRVITLKDFRAFCAARGIAILKEVAVASHPGAGSGRIVRFLPDWFARYGIFLISRER